MKMFIIQSLLLMAIAFILGCILGCMLRRLFAGPAVAIASPAPEKKAVPVPPKAKRAAPKPALARAAAAPAKKDNLKRILGVGRQNEARLNKMGITTFAQIAAWSAREQADIGERLAFPGRIEREDWVRQARVLAKGGQTDFSKRVSKGEISTSTGKGTTGNLGKKPPVLSKAPSGGGDNLTLIDGVGNALEKKLFALGIYKFDQIAKWTKDHEAWAGNELGFPGRPEREHWVAEARILAKGGMTQHAKRVERGEITSSRKSRK